MKKSHMGLWMGLSVLLVAAVYSVVLLLLKETMDVSAWVLYGFTMVAFVLTGVQMIAVTGKHDGVVLDAALGVITMVYFGLQVVLGGMVCMLFADLPLTPVLVFEIVLLAAYLLASFLMYGAQSHHAAQRHNDQRSVRRIRLLEADVRTAAEGTQEPSLRKALEALAEEFHYSDPIILPELAEIDGRIVQRVASLSDALADESGDPFAEIEGISRLIRERSRMAAILKQ